MPPRSLHDQPHARREALDELVRAVGRSVGGDDELELLGGIVEREQVLEPPLDHGLLVVGGDDHRHRRLDRLGSHRPRPHAREQADDERVERVRPDERAEREPEDDLDRDHATSSSQQRAVAADRDRAVGLLDDVGAAARPHLVEVVPARAQLADRVGEELRPTRRDHEPAADVLDHLRRLALRIGGDDHRPPGREDPVEPARDDVAREPAAEADDVDVRARERLRERLARLVGEELDGVDLEQLREGDELLVPRAEADDQDPQVVEVAQERGRADEAVEVLRVADVARVHDDEPARRAGACAPTRCRGAAA